MSADHPDRRETLRRFAREAAWTAVAALVVVGFCLFFLARDPRYFWNDDVQTYQLANYRDMARSWQAGELPLLSPYSWQGGALAAEYQNGVFSVFITGLVLTAFGLGLSLPAAAALLAIAHFAVLAAGAFRLARSRGLTADAALLVAVVASLHGWIFLWGGKYWFPALAGCAWLPWAWWALEWSLKGDRGLLRFLPAGLFIYLLVAAGWPFAVLMLAVVTAWLALRTAREGSPRTLWAPAAAWAVGLGLSAPAWLMLVEYTGWSARQLDTPLRHVSSAWMVTFDSLPGLAFPGIVSLWRVFDSWRPHVCMELTGGLVPLALVAAALACLGREFLWRRRWEIGLCVASLVLCLLPGLGPFQYGFRWLPLFFLALALLGAQALADVRAVPEELRTPAWRYNLGRWAAYLLLPVWGRALLVAFDPGRGTMVHGGLLAGVCLFWAWAEARRPATSPLRVWMPGAAALLSCLVMYVDGVRFPEVPSWAFDERMHERPHGLDPDRRYFSVYTREDFSGHDGPGVTNPISGAGMGLLPANSPLYAGVHAVHGYSPMTPLGMRAVFGLHSQGYMSEDAAGRLLTRDAQPGGLLETMGVHGLLLADSLTAYEDVLLPNGWYPVARVDGGHVYHRDGEATRVRTVSEALVLPHPYPVFRKVVEPGDGPRFMPLWGSPGEEGTLSLGTADLRVVSESRTRLAVEVTGTAPDRETLVLFTRAWYPGYVATLNGQPVPLYNAALLMPAARLPVGAEGRLVLEYRPRSLVLGCRLATGTAVFCLLASVLVGLGRMLSPRAGRRLESAGVTP